MRIFRKLRRYLIENKKAGRYVLYAIGEILLVVIGILLAIYLNNLKNERELESRQAEFISQLNADLTESTYELRKARNYHRRKAIQSNFITKAFWKPELQHDSLSLHLIDALNVEEQYRPTLGTIVSLVNSGNIELIKSDEIRLGILNYLEKVDAILEDLKSLRQEHFSKGSENFPDHFDVSSFKRSFQRRSGFKPPEKTKEESALQPWPADFEEVPFPIELGELFTNVKVYRAYYGISIGHLKSRLHYSDLLAETNNLIRILER
ncbi:MAG: hypothetical protein KJO77_08240 [Bacteroidia bacterium]|nr:hypothetical protein [Bacteroidia bacterium]NND52225.1 hypothetical protein [Flavobacteriaceae bacterium]